MKEKEEGGRGFDIKVLGSWSWEVGVAEAGQGRTPRRPWWTGGGGGWRRGMKRQTRLHPNHPQIPVDRRTLTSSLVC